MLRRLLMFCVVAALTAGATSWWLYEGDLAEAVAPVVPEWNADQLALRAGVVDPLGAPAEALPAGPDEEPPLGE